MACPAPLSRANLAFLGSALLAKFVANFHSQGHSAARTKSSQFIRKTVRVRWRIPMQHLLRNFLCGIQWLNVASEFWETDFYTPPMLRGAALFDTSAPTVYENPVP